MCKLERVRDVCGDYVKLTWPIPSLGRGVIIQSRFLLRYHCPASSGRAYTTPDVCTDRTKDANQVMAY